MINGPKKDIPKKALLVVLVFICNHLIIVTWQKYLYKVVSEINFCRQKSHFWPILRISNNMEKTIFQKIGISEVVLPQKKGF